MKKVEVTIIAGLVATMMVASTSIADVLWIPGSIKVEKFKSEMKVRGIDLSGTDDSDGLVEQLGTKIKVVTYGNVTMEQLEYFKEAAALSLRS